MDRQELTEYYDAVEALALTGSEVGIPIDFVESGDFVKGSYLSETTVIESVS
jgi:hypothetical protein